MALAAGLCLAACAATPPPAAPAYEALVQATPLPEGFVWQRLSETDGQVAMPSDWFFASNGTADGWTWLFTKEDTRAGNYVTGARLRIYLLSRLRLAESDGAKVAERILQQIRARATRVVAECPAEQLGRFMRQCVETLEPGPGMGGGAHRVLYSVHWGALGMVYTFMFGAPVREWDSTSGIRRVMATGTLIGPNLGRSPP